jgi:hypothetical protein
MLVAKPNSPSTGMNAEWRRSRLSRRGFSTTASPFKNRRSKAKTQTLTLTSSILTSFFFRVMSCWKGRTFFSTVSQPTLSQSRTKLLVSGFTHVFNFAKISGYFLDKSSELREKIAASPPVDVFVAAGTAPRYCCGESLAT